MSYKIKRILLADVTVLRVILGCSALLFAFGLWFADSKGGAYEAMLRHAPAWLWGFGFFVYGLAKFEMTVHRHGKLVSYSLLLLGIYLWFFTFMSFADNPNRPMGSADVILFILVLMEFWVGSSNISGASDDSTV